MKTGSAWIEKAAIYMLGAIIAVDCGLVLYTKAVARNIVKASQGLGLYSRFGDKPLATLPPDGFTAAGMRSGVGTNGQSGWAVRYASRSCEYCRQDEPQWDRMATALKELGYQIIVLVPDAKNEYPSESQALMGGQQESFVNMGWIKQFRLTATPTLLIFSPNQGLIWSHRGTLGPDDPGDAIRTIKSSRTTTRHAS